MHGLRLSQTSLKNYLFYVRDGEGEAPPYYTALAMGPVTTAVLDDTCGNLIQIAAM